MLHQSLINYFFHKTSLQDICNECCYSPLIIRDHYLVHSEPASQVQKICSLQIISAFPPLTTRDHRGICFLQSDPLQTHTATTNNSPTDRNNQDQPNLHTYHFNPPTPSPQDYICHTVCLLTVLQTRGRTHKNILQQKLEEGNKQMSICFTARTVLAQAQEQKIVMA